jgi:hypothetical protein
MERRSRDKAIDRKNKKREENEQYVRKTDLERKI